MRRGFTVRLAGLAIAAMTMSASTSISAFGRARPRPQAPNGASAIALEPVVTGLSRPVYLTHAGDGSGRLFVVEKVGRIRIIQNGSLVTTPFLDISSRVESGGNEQGLLSVAFHPNYETNRRFFVYYVAKAVSGVDDGTLTIAEYQAMAGNPNLASTTEKVLLRIPHPGQQNHNGGLLKFGPDGFLYAGIGDGGGAGDPGPPRGTARTRTSFSARCCASTSTPARRTGFRRPTRLPMARTGSPRSSPTAFGIPGAGRSIDGPERSGSATSVRTRSKKSTS